MNKKEKKLKPGIKKKMSPYLIIVLSFLSVIIIGALLLSLPFAKQEGVTLSFLDTFFISTSAVTITGLSPIHNLSTTFSVFGKVVIALLTQIGGLGIITLSVFVMILIGMKIGISNRVLLQTNLNSPSMAGVVNLIKKIVIFTLIVEFIGFLINLAVFIPLFPLPKAIGISAFHAIASFNNSGFDILGDSSLINYQDNILLLINTALMIMIGGLGFIAIQDIFTKRSIKKLSIHTKIVIKVNLFLWIVGTLVIKLAQIGGESTSWLTAFFMSVSARTAGFAAEKLVNFHSLSLLMLICLMFIGGSPSSTAGGIKTTTFYTLTKSMISYGLGKPTTTYNRVIDQESKNKAFLLLFTALTGVVIGTALILFFDNLTIGRALFETVSALSNVGLSVGTTATLSSASKVVLIVLMFAGRVGPLTIMSLMNRDWYKIGAHPVDYLEEKIIIG
ncbi:MAG TPA: potassium transporter TrkG [Bacilli bacterium]|nr:potassium transporter TrkG [Bacilli bacterium]HOQ70911.1 potassium transporter TrkG [Bacilli bacterium]HPK28617.1 potassium transporter TrkG [Bacilli bacterium]